MLRTKDEIKYEDWMFDFLTNTVIKTKSDFQNKINKKWPQIPHSKSPFTPIEFENWWDEIKK